MKPVYMSDLSTDTSRSIQVYEQAVVAEANARAALDQACKLVVDARQTMIQRMLAEGAERDRVEQNRRAMGQGDAR